MVDRVRLTAVPKKKRAVADPEVGETSVSGKPCEDGTTGTFPCTENDTCYVSSMDEDTVSFS